MVKRVIVALLLVMGLGLLLAGCGGGDEAESPPAAGDDQDQTDAGPEVDPDSGMLINPLEDPGEPFIVVGKVDSLNLIPQISPEFVIRADHGKTYRIRTQDLAETYFESGDLVTPSLLRQGMEARATVTYDATQFIHFSDDLLFLGAPE